MTDSALTLLTSPAELGLAIRQARARFGWSQREAARRCRVGPRFLLELENGKTTARLDKVLTVMFALNLIAIVVPFDEAMAALGPKR